MAKVLVVLVVAALAFGGWKLAHRAGRTASGTLQTVVESIPDQAALAAAEANLQQAASVANAYQEAGGGFSGLTVPGATVRSATATGYCLEATVRGVTAHLSGPNGTPAAGACPAG